MEHMGVFNAEKWRNEALAVIRDIECGVAEAKISEQLGCLDTSVHINVTTIEGESLCIEMCGRGFRVVGKRYDDASEAVASPGKDSMPYYETPYALMNVVSAQFCQQFGQTLAAKLLAVQNHES